MEICVIGDKDSAPLFLTLGLKVHIVSDVAQAKSVLKKAAEESAIIYITEKLAKDMDTEIQELNERLTPAIVLIPSYEGSLGIGILGVQNSAKRAVGADFLFGEEKV